MGRRLVPNPRSKGLGSLRIPLLIISVPRDSFFVTSTSQILSISNVKVSAHPCSMESKPRLSCEQCRKRKIKCDKQAPCSSCRAAGIICEVVQRDRLPRGKSGKARNKDGLLESRVARIESLLAQAQVVSSKGAQKPANKASPSTGSDESDLKTAARLNDYVATDFWEQLTQEVAGLRETFDEQSDDDEAQVTELGSQYTKLDLSAEHGKFLFASSPSTDHGYVPPFPSNELRATLLGTYKFRCEAVYKLMHWPTALAKIEAANALAHDGTSSAYIGIEFAIYFMAVCSLQEEEATFTLMGHDRTTLLQQYMRATEWALSQCNLMQRPDMDSLLAFTLYLNCIWACGKYATKWTLTALAVRIGESLGLGREDPRMYTVFDLECRRRLWWGIGMLDAHSVYDRGSVPIMTAASLGPRPLNINDADMSPTSKTLVPAEGITEMTFTLLGLEAVIHNKKMYEATDWASKLQLVADYQAIADRAIATASGDSLMHKLIRDISRNIAGNMHLLLRRPPYRVNHHEIPEDDDFDIMGCAIHILEMYAESKRGELAAWEWKDWIPWYALAVVLAELCKTPTGPTADRAWAACLELYRRNARPSSDLESGSLWKPITKLMRRVQRERPYSSPEQLILSRSSTSPPIPLQGQFGAQGVAPNNSDSAMGFSSAPCYSSAQGFVGAPTTSDPNIVTSGMPAWPPFDPNTPLLDMHTPQRSMSLYNHLDPANGVSWLDWDTLLDDHGYPMSIG